MAEDVGVLQQETDRSNYWTQTVGIPDRIEAVMAHVVDTCAAFGPSYKTPVQVELDAFFAANPEVAPPPHWNEIWGAEGWEPRPT